MRRDVFQAIADPTRREIIGMIASCPMNLNAIASKFDISRPAISKHIKILSECGMIQINIEGRERVCHPNLESLSEVATWIEHYKLFWNNKLNALGNYLDEPSGARIKKHLSKRKPKKLRK